jgi:hypothetical protein
MGTESISFVSSRTMDLLTFHAKRIKTGPTGILRMNLLKPFSASPSVSFKASSLIFKRYSALITAVVTSFAVYAIGLPICSVSSLAKTSSLLFKISKAFVTIACLSFNVVLRQLLNASVARVGKSSRSEAEMPFLVKTGLLVIGDMVVIVSTDILRVLQKFLSVVVFKVGWNR